MADPLRDEMWLHAGARPPAHAEFVASLVDGVVLQGPTSSKKSASLIASIGQTALQHDGRESELSLLDPDEDWLLHQQASAFVTSRVLYVPPPTGQQDPNLRDAVTSAQLFLARPRPREIEIPAMAVVAVAKHWLSGATSRAQLIHGLETIDGPIGLMLHDPRDPLDNARAVEGLAQVVASDVEIALLRSDHGAIGAYAFGAAGGSIGINASSRHFIPPGERGFADNSDPTPRVFVPALLEWWKGSRLALTEGDQLFDCFCNICQGASLARFQDERLKPQADAHSAASWYSLFRSLAALPAGSREAEWISLCKMAYENLDELEDRFGILQPPSKQLKAWLRFSGVPAVA